MSLAPRMRSGAPVSSTLMWEPSVQTTACAGPSIEASATLLAPVPLHTISASQPPPNRSRKRATAAVVQRSFP